MICLIHPSQRRLQRYGMTSLFPKTCGFPRITHFGWFVPGLRTVIITVSSFLSSHAELVDLTKLLIDFILTASLQDMTDCLGALNKLRGRKANNDLNQQHISVFQEWFDFIQLEAFESISLMYIENHEWMVRVV